MKNYRLSPESLASKPRDVLAKELNELIRKDIVQGGMAYNSLMRDLKRDRPPDRLYGQDRSGRHGGGHRRRH